MDYRGFLEKAQELFKSSGFVKAEKTPWIDLAMGKQLIGSFFTLALLREGVARTEKCHSLYSVGSAIAASLNAFLRFMHDVHVPQCFDPFM